MKKMNADGNFYESKLTELWPFKWSEFITEEYEPDQKFIFIFNDGEEMILEHRDFVDNIYIKWVGVSKYLPIHFGVVK